MKLVIRNNKDWLFFFENVKKLQEKYGSNIIRETLEKIYSFQNNTLPFLGASSLVLDELHKINIINLEDIIIFLNTIKNIYSLDNIIKNIKELEENLNITSIGFIIKGNKLSIYLNSDSYRKIILPYNIESQIEPNLFVNRLYETNLLNNDEFIIEQSDIASGLKKIYCSKNFILNYSIFNINNNINYFSEKNKFLKSILDLKNKYQIEIIVSNPNKIYLNDNQYNNYTTYHLDGDIYDKYGELLNSTNIYWNEDEILVKDANFLALTTIENYEIKKIILVVKDCNIIKSCKDYQRILKK